MAERKIMPPPLVGGANACSRCKKNYFCYSYFIKPCFCQENAHIHEQCLEKSIKLALSQNPHAICNSGFEGFLQYKCPLCFQEILFREGFKSRIVCWSQIRPEHRGFFVRIILFILAIIGIMIFMLLLFLDREDVRLFLIIIEFLLILNLILRLFTVYMMLKKKFFQIEGELLIRAGQQPFINEQRN